MSAPRDFFDLLGDGLLLKRVLRHGPKEEPRPLRRGDRPVIRYRYKVLSDPTQEPWTQNPDVFFADALETVDSLEVSWGEGHLVKALELAVGSMQIGERAVVKSAPVHAYGEAGRTELKIPSNATMAWDVELISLTAMPRPEDAIIPEDLSPEERRSLIEKRINDIERLKNKANELFTAQNFEQAKKVYLQSKDILQKLPETDTDLTDRMMKLDFTCTLNMAAVELKLKNYVQVIQWCNEALQREPNNVKALYRKAQAFMNLSEFPQAIALFKKVIEQEPSNKDAVAMLSFCERKHKAFSDQEKKAAARFLGGYDADQASSSGASTPPQQAQQPQLIQSKPSDDPDAAIPLPKLPSAFAFDALIGTPQGKKAEKKPSDKKVDKLDGSDSNNQDVSFLSTVLSDPALIYPIAAAVIAFLVVLISIYFANSSEGSKAVAPETNQ